MTYPQALNYLNSFVNYERLTFYPYKSSFKLGRVQRLLQLLGNPQQGSRVIHIAGTKGKGSTCAFVANILREAGFKVGLYTSPHLIDVRERICILQSLVASSAFAKASAHRRSSLEKEKISRKDFARLMKKLRPHAEKLRKTRLGSLSYYEILTSLAFLYFKEEECDFVVLETGIGGRLDATNVCFSLICGLTPISYEHTQVLGKTLEKIAAEKTAIIKSKKQIVVSAPQRPTVQKVIKERVRKCRAKLIVANPAQYPGLRISLLGAHQIINASVAVAVVESLRHHGINISKQAVKKGLKNTRWPGRLQIISRKPRIVLDGAQNRASSLALKEALHKFFKYRNLILVFGVSQDKDVRGILKELSPCATKIILTKSQNPRALAPETIKTFIRTNGKPIVLTQNSMQALRIARQSARQKDLILVCGSLFLVGEVIGVTSPHST